MSSCCSTFGGAAERQFGKKKAAQELASYRRHGARQTTSMLRDGLSQAGPFDGSLLDIGRGIGALTFELLGRGVKRAIGVDASTSYLDAAREEATRRSVDGLTQFVHGDFLLVSNSLPTAAVVTMDRVICCYPFFEPLLKEALAHARHCFAFSYPRDCWYVRLGMAAENGGRRLVSNRFRTFVHPVSSMEELLRRGGFHLSSRSATLTWAVDVYLRNGS